MTESTTEFQRLMEVIREQKKSVSELSEILGLSQNTIYSWISNQRGTEKLKTRTRSAVVDRLGISYRWLTKGEGPKYEPKDSVERIPEIIKIGLCDVSFGCGLTYEPSFEEEQTGEKIPFSRDMILRLGVDYKSCKLVKAKGDSMAPTINDGDLLLLECKNVSVIEDDKAYALVTRSGLTVKRLNHLKQQHMVIVSSDNSVSFNPKKMSEADFRNEVYFIYRICLVIKENI